MMLCPMVYPVANTPMTDTASTTELIEYDPTNAQYDIYQCAECDNLVLSIGSDNPPMTCHDMPMDLIEDCTPAIRPPELRNVLLEAFGLPKAGLDICLCVIDDGPVTAGDIAGGLDYDRSTATRYLNKLIDIGLVQRGQQNRPGGGVVNVYRPVDLDQVRHETLVGFYVWAGEAASLIETGDLADRQQSVTPETADPGVLWEQSGDADC